ncbi:ABC transporter substrate-binding protein [Streptomyces antimycoticus]|uniref:ABC transporter substrate-binding protein n=1 Tax=Streptomyces antimycoticus TaxID=68175 RepID=UPI0038098653
MSWVLGDGRRGRAAGGNAPDVFQNSYAFLCKYGDKNLLLDLNGQAKAGNLSLKGFRNGLEKAGDIDGKLLGVPVGANTFALFYNPDVFKKAGVTVEDGWTWNDFFAAAKKVRKSDGTLYGASDNAIVMYLYDLYLRQNGKAFFTKDSKLGFTEDDLTEWWGRWQRHAKTDELVPGKKSEQAKPKASISADLSASEFTWDNFLVRFAAETKTTLDLGPIPTTDGKRTGQYLSSLMLSGSARTQHPKEVAQFIDFMTHDPEVGEVMGYNRGIPATNSQYDAHRPQGVDAKIAAYEKSVSAELEPITPHPAGADNTGGPGDSLLADAAADRPGGGRPRGLCGRGGAPGPRLTRVPPAPGAMGDGCPDATTSWKTVELEGPQVLGPGVEAAWVSTNATAQYGLAAIQNLALVGDKLPGWPRGHGSDDT